MPVGTKATVKAVPPREMGELGAQLLLANTYHLYFRPGVEMVAAHGGLHGFMRLGRPILTDSGGFQVFSLADTRVRARGRRRVHARSTTARGTSSPRARHARPGSARRRHRDVLDKCAPGTAVARGAGGRRGANDALGGRLPSRPKRAADQLLIGIVQGGVDKELRRRSAEQLLDSTSSLRHRRSSVGERAEEMLEIVELMDELLPRRYGTSWASATRWASST